MFRAILNLVLEAGKEVLEIYNRGFEVKYKEDKTPLTEADRISHQIITEGLQKLTPNIPIISEEGQGIPYTERKNFNKLWLVDPLDGTKEFINKRDEFTLNVALVVEGEPVLGVVYAPAKNVIYFAEKGKGAFKGKLLKGEVFEITKLPLRSGFYQPLRVIASRSHRDKETERFIQRLSQSFMVETTSAGSSLKFCLLAEGNADVYPRFGPTMEWDTAAGHAVLKEVGGFVYSLENLEELRYNKESLKNEAFVAVRREVAPHILPLLKSF